jgi:hypothetical protein
MTKQSLGGPQAIFWLEWGYCGPNPPLRVIPSEAEGAAARSTEGGVGSSHALAERVREQAGAIFAECEHIHIAHKVGIYLTPAVNRNSSEVL